MWLYLGGGLDELLLLLTGGDQRNDTHGQLFIALSITNQHTLGVK